MRPARRDRGGALLLAGLILWAGPATAQSTLPAGPDCGGDAFSSAQVIENRTPRRGPLTSVPDTLCADVAPQGNRAPVEIGITPFLGDPGVAPWDGGRGTGDPYEGRPPRSRRP